MKKLLIEVDESWNDVVIRLLETHQHMLGRLTREVNILWILSFLQALVIMFLLWRV